MNYNPSDCCNLSFNSEKTNYIGNLKLLNNHKIGFFSSQIINPNTINKISEWLEALDNDTCIVSGFQSKNESKLLDMLLKNNKNIIMVLSKKIYDKCPIRFKTAVKNGKMLILYRPLIICLKSQLEIMQK